MTATCAPSCASAWQIRCPSPPLPPVTSATTPFRSIASLLYCECAVASPPLPLRGPLCRHKGDDQETGGQRMNKSCKTADKPSRQLRLSVGAGEGNRTLVCS